MYTLWQFTRHQELTAMRAGGVSIYRIMAPFLIVAVVFSLLTAVIRETVTPYAARWTQEFAKREAATDKKRILYDVAYFSSMGRRQWLIGKLDTDQPWKLREVKITCERADGTRYQVIETPKAEWLDGQWWFYDPVVKNFDKDQNPVARRTGAPGSSSTICEMTFFDERPADFVNETTNWEFLSSRAILRYLRQHPDLSPRDAAQKKLALHQRMSMPWACLIVTLFAIPAGVRGGRRSAVTGIFLTVAFFFGFYSLMQIGTFLAMRQLIWPWIGAWLSNIVFLGAGVVMAMRIR